MEKFGSTSIVNKNSILNTTGFKVNVILDVEDYKEKLVNIWSIM